MLRIGWFSTGRGEGSRRLFHAVVQAIADGSLAAEMSFVFSNREPGEFPPTDEFFDDVRRAGVPLVTLSDRRFRRERGGAVARKGEPVPAWRRDYDQQVVDALEPIGCDLGMLAGYMLVTTEPLFSWRPLLNLHPAAPGGLAGTWQDVIWDVIERRSERSGAYIHLSTAALDAGPIVTYCTYSLRGPTIDLLWRDVELRGAAQVREEEGEHAALFREIRRRGAAREVPLVIETLRAAADGRLHIEDGVVLSGATRIVGGFDLTPEIERDLSKAIAP